MIIDITSLKNNSTIKINENIIVDKDILEKSNIIELKDSKVMGEIIKDNLNEYILNVIASGIMVLPDSLTLKPVDYEFSTEIEGNIAELLEEINESSKKTEFSIDIFPIIWENILMEIPMRVGGEDLSNIQMEGDGWKLIQERDETSINPEFEKLKELLNEK